MIRPVIAAIAALTIAAATPAGAQSYPSRVIKLVVPYTAGSPNDVMARLLTQNLQPRLGQPIVIDKTRPVRIYLVNVTEFDPINSFHLHANFFDYDDTGTNLTPTLRTVDLITQCQAQRGILEFSYKYPGRYMFHAHKTEFAELGWTGVFEVQE